MIEGFVKQVGGVHYQQDGNKPQHWDLAIMYQWDPFQYQITKYVMRWKDKYHGNPEKQLEDLKKARSFLDKYIANYEKYLGPTEVRVTNTPAPGFSEDHGVGFSVIKEPDIARSPGVPTLGKGPSIELGDQFP